jgi:hypothetical protein
MKNKLYILSALWLFLVTSAYSTAATSSRDIAKQQLAIRAAAKEAIDNLDTLATTNATDITILTAALRNTMLQNAKKYSNSDKSRTLCKNILTASKQADADTILKNAVKQASTQSPLPITEKDITAKLGSNWNKQVTLVAGTFANNFIDSIYKEARTDAVTRQRTKIEKNISYPAFKDLDAKLTEQTKKLSGKEKILNQKSFNALLPWVKLNITANTAVFDENQPAVKQLGNKVLKDIQAQYEQQIKTIDNSKVPATALLSNEINKYITEKLNKNITSIKTTSGNEPYPVFNAIKQYTTQQSEQLQNKHLKDFICRSGTISIANNAKKIIEEDPAAHRNPKTCRETFRQIYSKQQLPLIAEKYIKSAGRNKDMATVTAISNLIKNNPDINKTFQKQINTVLDKTLPPIRAAIAQEQFKTIFPALAEKTPFTEPMIEFIHDQQTTSIKNISMLIKLLATDSSYTTIPHEKNDLLKETDTIAINTANELAEPLVLALDAQLQTLQKMEKENLEQLKKDIADKKTFNSIKKEWQNQLQQSWKKQSTKYPEQAQTLFKRTEKELDKTVRQLYDTTKSEQIKQEQIEPTKTAETSGGKKTTSYDSEKTEVPDPEQEQKKQEEKKEEEQTNDDKNSGIEDNLTMFKGSADFVLRLSDTPDGRCRVIFGCPSEGTSLEAHFMPTDIESAADTIATAINEQFAETLQSLAQSAQSRGLIFWKKTTPRIRVLVLENSKETRHITSILLQKKIKEQIKTWSEKENLKFRLDWQESPGL